MRRLFVPAIATVLCAVVLSSASAAIQFDPAKMMRASDVKIGMIGECWTVLQGTVPTKFHVRIEGLLPQSILGKPEILFRVIDGPIVDRNGPVMGGMSGSPVFVDGKLIGACAYTVLYEKEPAGGITPIEAMIEGAAGTVPAATKQAAVTKPVTLDGHTYTRVAEVGTVKPDGHTLLLERMAPPIYFTSGTERTNNWHSRLMGLLGLDAEPGASSHEAVKVDMQPGEGFGVALSTGDFLSYTFGTITWREGNDLLGFGHPFLGAGKVAVPLTSVFINGFTPNYRRTDKDGSIMDVLGTLTADSPWAVGGTLGMKCETVPATFRVVDETADKSKTFHCELAKDRNLTSGAALGTLFDAVNSLHYAEGRPGVINVRYRITGTSGVTITRSDIYYHSGDYSPAVGGDLGEIMRLLIDNRFEPQDIAKVEAEVHLRTEPEMARIERVYTEEQTAVAGRNVTMHVVLKPIGKPEVEKSFKFKLPLALPKGSIAIGVAGGETAPQLRAELSGFQPEFHSLARTISYIEGLESNNQMVAMIAYPTQGAAVEDTPMPGLPEAFRGRLTLGHRTGVRAIKDFDLQKVDMPWVIQGAYMTSLATVTLQGDRGAPESPKPATTPTASAGDGLRSAVDAVTKGTVPIMDWSTGKARVTTLRLTLPRRTKPSVSDDDDEETVDPDSEDVTAPAAEGKSKQDEPSKPVVEDAPKAEAGQVQAKLTDWTLSKYDELSKGIPDGLAIHTRGWLVPGLRFDHFADLPDPLIWDLAPSGDNLYVAAGLAATVYRVAGGKVEPFYSSSSDEILISCLAPLANGDLACGLIPGGKVTILGPDGKVKRSVDFDETYVWRLVPDGQDLLVATGHPGRIYRLSPDGAKKLVAVIPETHVTGLAVSPKGIYASTGDTGSVYLVTPTGQVQQLYETPDGDVGGLAVLDDGTVVATVSGKARVVALRPNGIVEEWYKDDKQKVWGLTPDHNSVLVSLGPPASLIRARGVNDWELVRTDRGTEVFSALTRNAAGQLLVAGCGPGTVLAQQLNPQSLVYTSQSHDATLPAHWLSTILDCGGDPTAMKVQTRTGASPAFEAGMWSAWSAATPDCQAFKCTSPDNRYVQVRVSADPAKVAALRSLIVRYEPQNRAPVLKVSAPVAAAALSGSPEVKWEVTDEDKDTTEVDIYLQGIGETAWTPLALRQSASPYKWDTTKTKDGLYRMRIVATDRPSRPTGALEASEFLAPLAVDNTKPTGTVTLPLKLDADGNLPVEILAQDNLTGVAAVTWRYPGTEVWYTASPDGGVWGGKAVVCRFTLPKSIDAGSKVVIRVRDAASNFIDLTLVTPKGDKDGYVVTGPPLPAKPARPAVTKPAAPK